MMAHRQAVKDNLKEEERIESQNQSRYKKSSYARLIR